MFIPNFLIIGAAKAGTTSLHQYLSQHPEIYMSPQKELNFFAFDGEECDADGPIDRAGKKRYEYLKRISITDIKSYQRQFDAVTNQKRIGESSPLYLYSPRAPKRIHQYKPDVKLIAILRNPVERAFSHFIYYVARGQELTPDFTQAVKRENSSIHNIWSGHRHYVRLGFYYTQLKHYFELFESNSIKIYLYDEFTEHPKAVLQDIFKFLDIDHTFVPDTNIRYKPSQIPRNQSIHVALSALLKQDGFLNTLLPAKLKTIANKLKNRNLINAKSLLPLEARNYLISIYREDILKLQDLIQQDLSNWLRVRI